jgi:DNA-directed RNA polymerase specialized sigma24 family protein
MKSSGSVSGWIDRLLAGDRDAVSPLWERYFHRLVELARKKLQNSPRRAADEEDVALSAFDSFCRHAQQGQFPDLRSRDSLWRLLAAITARKVAHLLRDESRKKRGGGKALRFLQYRENWTREEIDQLFSREPDPQFAAVMADQCTRLLRGLKDDQLEKLALWRMEGYTVEEIAQKMAIVPRSVKRKLSVIRNIWRREANW